MLQSIENIALLNFEEQFNLFKEVAKLVNSSDENEQMQGRNFLIKIIDVWERVPTQYKMMWEDLIESVGFYPYISKYKMHITDLDARIRQEYHTSSYIHGKHLHSKQKELSDLIFSKRNVVVSAPTSFGKSLLIEEIIASNLYNNIVIIQPTLALLDETRIKLKNYSNSYKIIVRTSQEFSKDKGNVFLLTAERVLEYPNMPKIDLLIIDEVYKLSKQRGDNRANILNIAFLRLMKNPDCRFYLLGPNIDDISDGFVQKYNAVFFKTDYSLVYTEEENIHQSVKLQRGGKVCDEDVFAVLDNTVDQSLIFCASPSAARKLAFAYCKHLENINTETICLPLVQWIEENLNIGWSLVSCLNRGIGIHDGSMPKHMTTAMIKYFNDKKLKFLFCTNTIIEGVNTSAKNVIFYDDKIGTRPVDYFDYANIRGRAGRLMEHCVGKVINLKKPPEKHEMIVDIPAFTQNPIDDEVLVNIEKEDIKPINKERFDKFDKLPDDLKQILKRNAVSIQDQLEILDNIKCMLLNPQKRKNIVWSDISDNLYNHLYAIFELIKDKFDGKKDNVMISTKWMANQATTYCYNKNIRKMIEDRIYFLSYNAAKKTSPDLEEKDFNIAQFISNNSSQYEDIVNLSIEVIFKFQKNWLQYKIPKWLNVVDSLQKYAAKELGVEAGDYSYVAEYIENEFMDKSIRILSEYGIPSSAILKISKLLSNDLKELSEDDVLKIIINNRPLINKYLTQYEIESLDRCL